MEILIGTACGLVMGTIFTIAWASMLLSSNRGSSRTYALITLPSRLPSSAVILPLAVMGAWGVVGGILGLMYLAAEELFPRGGLGSPNLVFTVAICLLTVNVLLLALWWEGRKGWWEAYGSGLTFAALFGWLMPWLAT